MTVAAAPIPSTLPQITTTGGGLGVVQQSGPGGGSIVDRFRGFVASHRTAMFMVGGALAGGALGFFTLGPIAGIGGAVAGALLGRYLATRGH